jgi:hypothetical protein
VITELDSFVERRLLTTDEDNGSSVIGVAHEAFLSAWPPLAEAITDTASALRDCATSSHLLSGPDVRMPGASSRVAHVGALPTDS